MFMSKITKLNSEEERLENQILNWLYSGEQFLNIITVPNNSSYLLTKVIGDYLRLNNKILYITNEEEEYIDVLRNFKKRAFPRNYAYLKNPSIELDRNLIVCNYDNALKLKSKFDIVIYDDIRSFPIYSKYEIIDIMAKCCKENGKLISYSVEALFNKKREICFPILENRLPLVEPRIVTTKIDLNLDIPYTIYEYLKWWLHSNKKIILYVPYEEHIFNVFQYIDKYCKELTNNIVCYYKNENSKKILLNFEKCKSGILITNDLKERAFRLYPSEDTNEMVFFSDNHVFDYKKLVYFCGAEALNKNRIGRELLFVANEENEQMYKAKNMVRKFNREAWEMGLLSI
ncbi:hypothetical protein KQI86_17395 [Clostridium sp. MSJ-11]|uniref:Comf operon protein A, DNA transporter ATPase n=1 Tax=Clostridium mobile TaxID=2841512 RepID=A0ABS6ELK8_9CLOT|nr:hypothetical protein [Clostridium mobile]MBU5486098.1 hypothetical protein [Clostridium mobile]